MGGYVLGVTGEGCGCVSMNVSADTTSVTCSGWTAAGQTCSFEVRTRSQDCGFVSSPAYGEKLLIGKFNMSALCIMIYISNNKLTRKETNMVTH